MSLGLSNLRLGLAALRGGGGAAAIAPVVSDFGSGSTDDLELDPPELIIEHNTSGTLTGDGDTSVTPLPKKLGTSGFSRWN
jgi:hypothetical protein